MSTEDSNQNVMPEYGTENNTQQTTNAKEIESMKLDIFKQIPTWALITIVVIIVLILICSEYFVIKQVEYVEEETIIKKVTAYSLEHKLNKINITIESSLLKLLTQSKIG